jgi:hypothetical protein
MRETSLFQCQRRKQKSPAFLASSSFKGSKEAADIFVGLDFKAREQASAIFVGRGFNRGEERLLSSWASAPEARFCSCPQTLKKRELHLQCVLSEPRGVKWEGNWCQYV